jgi:uncharacterized membrane protein YkvA (DUF1232 family)
MNFFQRWFKGTGGAGVAQMGVHLLALWKLFKHPQTPRAARWLAIAAVAYAVSPIDLIPDFIPLLGLLDELVLLPIAVALIVRLTPAPVWEVCLREARASKDALPQLWWGALGVLLVWALLLGALTWRWTA